MSRCVIEAGVYAMLRRRCQSSQRAKGTESVVASFLLTRSLMWLPTMSVGMVATRLISAGPVQGFPFSSSIL